MITLNIPKNNLISNDYVINVEQKDILNASNINPYDTTPGICSNIFHGYMLPIDPEYLNSYNHGHSCHEIMSAGLPKGTINNYLSYYFCMHGIADNEDIFKKKLKKILYAFLAIKEKNNINNLPIVYYQKIDNKFHLIFDFSNNSPYANSCLKLMVMLKLMRFFIKAEDINTYADLKSLILYKRNCDSRRDVIIQNIDDIMIILNNFNLLSQYCLKDVHNFFDSINHIKREINLIKNYDESLKLISRHPTHKSLNNIPTPKSTVVRLGTLRKETEETINPVAEKVINSYQSVLNSASKVRMKELFIKHGVKTAKYCHPKNLNDLNEFLSSFDDKTRYVIKSEFGSRGIGLYLKENKQQVIDFFEKSKLNRYGKYIVEKFYNYNLEYRIHLVKNKYYFYACRKMLKSDAEERWYRNNSNCVWILEGNKKFDKPGNWDAIIKHCQKAINAVGLDIGACDVRVQSRSQVNGQEPQDFIICEINSAPSFGNFTAEHYKTQIQILCADS